MAMTRQSYDRRSICDLDNSMAFDSSSVVLSTRPLFFLLKGEFIGVSMTIVLPHEISGNKTEVKMSCSSVFSLVFQVNPE